MYSLRVIEVQYVLCQIEGEGIFGVSIAGRQHLRWMVERKEIVDLVEIPVQAVVLPLEADHDVVDWDIRRHANRVLDV